VGVYHAGCSDNNRKAIHEAFLRDEIDVVVATVGQDAVTLVTASVLHGNA
jgi:superfamily II helicase